MLEEINRLGPFFEDCYREISVREYARAMNLSPPTASKLLKRFVSEGILRMREERRFLLFSANQDSAVMRDLSKIYWSSSLREFLDYLDSFSPKALVLFGSLSKLEAKRDSDIDILFLGVKKNLNLEKFEKKLKRKIQVFYYNSLKDINEQLRLNILNGFTLRGYLS